MPIRIPLQTILVTRDGKRVVPPLNKPFEFTAKEVEEINEVNPRAIRKPVQEVEAPVATSTPPAGEPVKGAKAAKAGTPNPDDNGGKGDDQL